MRSKGAFFSTVKSIFLLLLFLEHFSYCLQKLRLSMSKTTPGKAEPSWTHRHHEMKGSVPAVFRSSFDLC